MKNVAQLQSDFVGLKAKKAQMQHEKAQSLRSQPAALRDASDGAFDVLMQDPANHPYARKRPRIYQGPGFEA